jgi:hypothetical protein
VKDRASLRFDKAIKHPHKVGRQDSNPQTTTFVALTPCSSAALYFMRFDRFHKADKDLNQPLALQRLRIYLTAENDTVNKVLDHHQ